MDVYVIDHVDIGVLGHTPMVGEVVRRSGQRPTLDWPAPASERLRGEMRLADYLGPDAPYEVTDRWLAEHLHLRWTVEDLQVLATGVAWMGTAQVDRDGPFPTAVHAQKHLAAIPASWPTVHLARQARTATTTLAQLWAAAVEAADDAWAAGAPDAWAILHLLANHTPGGDRSRLARRWRGALIACVDPVAAHHDDPDLRATARRALAAQPAYGTDVPVDPGLIGPLHLADRDQSMRRLAEGLLVSTSAPLACWHSPLAADASERRDHWQVRLPDWAARLLTILPDHQDPQMLTIATTPIPHATDLVSRYCGHTGETWAYAYYDQVPPDHPQPSKLDLLCAAVMHGPLRRLDLQWYDAVRPDLAALLMDLPHDLDLADADDDLLDLLASRVEATAIDATTRSLTTKVLHRHRPRLVVIDERDLARRYGAATPAGGRLGYRDLLPAVREDLRSNADALTQIRADLDGPGAELSPLRLLDIAAWMAGRTTLD